MSYITTTTSPTTAEVEATGNKEVELKFRLSSSSSEDVYRKWDVSHELHQYYLKFTTPFCKLYIERFFPEFSPSNWSRIKEARIRSKTHLTSRQSTYTITLKSDGGLSRDEFENEINESDFKFLLSNHAESHIHKVRSVLNCATHPPISNKLVIKDPSAYQELNFEFDMFIIPSSCPNLIELEFDPSKFTREELTLLTKAHFGSSIVDVTEDKSYKNAKLAVPI